MEYTKLSDLVGKSFMVESVGGYTWKMWDNASRRMVTRDTWLDGFSKKYQAETDKGKLDLSASQLGQLLEAVSKNGQADLTGKTFEVKSNGKTGMEIRYFFNSVGSAQTPPVQTQVADPPATPADDIEERGDDSAKHETRLNDDDIDLSEIPF